MLLDHGNRPHRSEQAPANGEIPGIEVAAARHHGSGPVELLLNLRKAGLWGLPLLAPDCCIVRCGEGVHKAAPSPRPEAVLNAPDQPSRGLKEMQPGNDGLLFKAL